ncbi:ribonuclease Z [Kribbella sp. VKM Ac-2527]|uniref:Ribonuclease Z n=1 Tax=Kribbella caucasensis TaxID=2512215 RepID=A0A4R6KBM3_9ACTN|nr:ribonuclease Z [Kribbella sp. VKM Ac-2527]TDO45706.1 ribonuclease Z [Kribbella sp. VKM Ac-2527]
MRELVVLGTGSQVATRERNQNGYFLRWDSDGFLFDPGEGTQRQMLYAGIAAGALTRLCVTHFHGDHCLGVPGVIQRLSLDDVPHPVHAHYPASGQRYFERLRYAASFYERAEVREEPVEEDGLLSVGPFGQLWARRLEHPVEAFGYQLVEPDGRRMLPDKLAQYGVRGPAVGKLQRSGSIVVDGRSVTIEEVSEPRPGQRFAFIMDTRLCEGVFRLADGADMLVIESTYLSGEATLARRFGHLTAGQAARVARECGVRTLVLTHFSQRYTDLSLFREEAAAEFDGEIFIATDLARIPVPSRR